VITPQDSDRILEQIRSFPQSGAALRRHAMELLNGLPGYNWSGVYRLEGEVLVLDEYVGAATDHTRIQVGVGVCGTAVKEDANQVIEDVREIDNYLACSLQTRSEIVVLIRKEGQVLGQIDIDGHEVGAFDKTDEAFLERVGELLAERWR
jgi:L-methionine (R)-S-oxide reductase